MTYQSGTQIRLRSERAARLRAKGRTLCPVPRRDGGQCLGWVQGGLQACSAPRDQSGREAERETDPAGNWLA